MFSKSDSELYFPSQDSLAKTTHLAVAAHQDDVEFMAYHGIIECYNNNDKGFSAAVVTNGSGSPRAGEYADYTDQQMMLVRRDEQKRAADIGKYTALALLMYPSAEVKDGKNQHVVDDILSLLKRAKPEIVYTHNLADKHDTHVATALRTIAAIRRLPKNERPKRVYGCEVWRDLDWLNDSDKQLLDVSRNQPLAAQLMEVFKSQIAGGKRYDLAVTGRRLANATFFQDHEVDTHTHLTYALDLTPLIEDDSLTVAEFLSSHLSAFMRAVLDKARGLE